MAIVIPFFSEEFNNREIIQYFQSLTEEEKEFDRGDFYQVLDTDVSHIDSRATVDSVQIDGVDVEVDAIFVSYTVFYSVYNGCKDMDVNDSLDYTVEGIRVAEGWKFEEFEPPKRRSTLEEF